MSSDLIIYNYSGELTNVVPNSTPFLIVQGSSDIRRLDSVSAVTRGSGYTDTEIARTNADNEDTFTGDASTVNAEYKLNWGKGLAQATAGGANGISSVTVDSGGVFPSGVTAVAISVNATGYQTIQNFAGTGTLGNISGGGGTQEITAVSVTTQGIYVPISSERSFEFVFTVTPSSESITTAPSLTETLDAYGGVFPVAVTAVTLSIGPASGWGEVVSAEATATIGTISGSTLKEVSGVTVSNPGVYVPIQQFQGQRSENPVEISVGSITPSGNEARSLPTFSQTISNYLESVDIINAGGVITVNSPVLTLNAPAAQAGDASIVAATATFSTETFRASSIDFEPSTFTAISLKIDVDNLRHILASAGKINKLSKTPFSNVKRGENVLVPGNVLGEITGSPNLNKRGILRFLLFLIPFFSFSVCENEFDRLQIEVRDRVSKENAEKRKEKLLELLNTHQDYLPTLIASNSELREEYLSLLKHDHSLDPNIQVIISRNLRLSRRIKSNKNDT